MHGDKPGKVIAGRYELLELAGEGGMAVVWRAVVRGPGRFARPVAVKRIHTAKGADQHFVLLFEEEARVGAGLHHPNIVQIMDFGVDDEGDYYLVMEWVEGLDLHHWARSFPRGLSATPWPLVTSIGVEVLRALAAAHGRVAENGETSPVIHRDVSPSNVLLGTNGTVKLVDFGLARAMDRASMTRPNVIKGKLAYCAPELITGAKAGPHSDMFALSVVLWESLAQQRLFTGKNDLEVLLSVRKGEIQSLSELRSDLPGALVSAIHQGLEPKPSNRFEDATAMARALSAILHQHTEPTDSEPLGRSVREARERLGIKPSPGRAPDAVEDLSLSDVEIVEGGMSEELDISIQGVAIPESVKSAPVRGLWSDAPAQTPADPSVSFELTRKKR